MISGGNEVCVGIATNGFWNHTILDCWKCGRLIETRHLLTATYFQSCSSCWPRTQRGWDDITTFMPHLPLPYVCYYFPIVMGCCPNARKHTFHTLLDGTKEFREPKQKADCHIVLNKNVLSGCQRFKNDENGYVYFAARESKCFLWKVSCGYSLHGISGNKMLRLMCSWHWETKGWMISRLWVRAW